MLSLNLTGHRIVITTGNSMYPTWRWAVMLVVKTPLQTFNPGDIIVYNDQTQFGKFVTHRYLGDGVIQGDNPVTNALPDPCEWFEGSNFYRVKIIFKKR